MKYRNDDPYLRERARAMRHDATGAEALVWSRLRRGQLGTHFRRQEPLGPFIVDFVCVAKRLVVEIDGDTHEDVEVDQQRDEVIREAGFTVLRFWNSEVYEDLDAVIRYISLQLMASEEG